MSDQQKTTEPQKYRFSLRRDEIIKIGGIPYRHVGDGMVEGATDPALARDMRDAPDEAADHPNP